MRRPTWCRRPTSARSRALPTYRGEAPARAWLLSIARHVCADHVRRRQRQRRLVDKLGRHAHEAPAAAPDSVDDMLATLQPDRREAFVLTQYVGLGYEEAAAVVGCPVGTIRSTRLPGARRPPRGAHRDGGLSSR